MGKLYLVTGGTGFLGSALVRRLLRDGKCVRVLDNQSRGRVDRLADVMSSIEYVAGDIRNAAEVEQAAAGVDSVCHLAFVNGTEFFYTKPELVLEVGVKGIVNVLDACLRHSVPELILASSSEVYHDPSGVPTGENVPLSIPDPMNPRWSYSAGKIISEMMALNYGRTHFRRVLIFRPHNVYGPDMGWEHVIPQFVLRMEESAANAGVVRFPIQGSGDQTRSFVFIDDFVDGLTAILRGGTHLGIYNIGTREEVRIADLARMIAGLLGVKIEIVPGPAAAGGTSRRCPDIAKIAALGYAPKISLREGLAITTKWYRENARLAPAAKAGD
ncbi:MAG TPA: NAD-dependent epimerase/dehydratase family protein [Candidatus Limnocylindrales bacterium]|nr:NAD-dependent epimerase/dehydratase family protein [Candidatus Limnocylindrales bacterium]